MNGYGHESYAESLRPYGTPIYLPTCKGWLLERTIPGTDYKDAMGCYPIFCCEDWHEVRGDLEGLKRLVSAVVVTDPFSGCCPLVLGAQFDIVKPFKSHYVADLSVRLESFVCRHHHRYARKASQELWIECMPKPEGFADAWVSLYNNLVMRHEIRGMTNFPPETLAAQLSVPGIVVFVARDRRDGGVVSMLLWYVQGDVVYYHLGASNDLGYQIHASYALFWEALEFFAQLGLTWADLGGAPGVKHDQEDTLGDFKAGWSTGVKPVYLCGTVLNREAYDYLTPYFPAYRKGEFS